ncbi:GspE/PulE family protein [Chitinivorax sp. PXF-14]|uniref:GspE/PulE family protein n=1 Tax=Chitinivorax sp. PXF-14 TaxID=3230488 RepID=UPI0034675897
MDTTLDQHPCLKQAHNRAELCGLLAMRGGRGHRPLGQHLLQANLVSPERLTLALGMQKKLGGKKLGDILVTSGSLSQNDLDVALVEALDVPRVALKDFDVDPAAAPLLGDGLIQRYRVLPLMVFEDSLVVASDHILPSETVDALRFATQRRIVQTIVSNHDLETALGRDYQGLAENFNLSQFEAQRDEADNDQAWAREAELAAQQQPIVKLVDSILYHGIQQKASDIHLRPEHSQIELLYRIDGTLVKARQFPKSVLSALVSRIKILASLNIAERRLPQDGRVRFNANGNNVDLRVSIIPVHNGESVVIRVLNKNQGMRSVHELGLKAEDEARLLNTLNRSHGILLVTGPTGSGKSTTLYAALQEIYKTNSNIITVEDPVEYDMPGVRQIEVMPNIGYSFARALRAILRHDPDTVMIGEMRDGETCKIAVESALTGHLVLSTLHTNDAASSIVRLMEIGVEPYMIRAALIGVMAQRLVRLNCPHCLGPEDVPPLMREHLQIGPDEQFVAGQGCDLCHGTGFAGRQAVYELLTVDDALRNHIHAETSADELHELAIAHGMTPMSANGMELARQHKVSVAEVYRACM